MKKTILAVMATLLLAYTTNAQEKLGHINSITILQAMPEFKQMSDDIEKQKESYSKALEGMYSDYDAKQKELQKISGDKTTPDPIVESKIQELQDLQKRIEDFQSKANDDLQKLQQDKLKPINDKYLKAVKEVAQEKGYSYVFDVVSGGVAYFPETDDLTDLVLKKLGVTAIPTTSPTGNQPSTPISSRPKTGGK